MMTGGFINRNCRRVCETNAATISRFTHVKMAFQGGVKMKKNVGGCGWVGEFSAI